VKRPETSRTVVLDATVVIHLAQAGRLNLLGSLSEWVFVVPDQVVEEVSYPTQAEALKHALQASHLRRESSTDPAEIDLYAELRQRMGKGEAALSCHAATRGWMLASDDRGRAFRRLMRERIGSARSFETADLLRIAQRSEESARCGERGGGKRDVVG